MKILITEEQILKIIRRQIILLESEKIMDALLNNCVLSFSTENTKLGPNVATFSLPAGWTCPFAEKCLKKVERERFFDPEKVGTFTIDKKTGEKIPYKGEIRMKIGPNTQFFCYSAGQEMLYDKLREKRWRNFDLLKMAEAEGGPQAQADLIVRSLKYFFDTEGEKNEVRIHESGDFYNKNYLLAWIEVAKRMPNVLFYGYTKSVAYVEELKELYDETPNLAITFSLGGRLDDKIQGLGIKTSRVFETPEEILDAGLILDLDDNLAKEKGGKDFALLLHGSQESGEKSKNKLRNETFIHYWKNLKPINRRLGYPENHRITKDEAIAAKKIIEEILNNPDIKVNKSLYGEYKKTLNYVIKYNEYNFSDNLINILPQKYRP